MPSELEATFALQLKALGVREPMWEYRFSTERRWRFDAAWPAAIPPLAVEIEGGTWQRGRHTSGAGFKADAEKYNAAALAGWCVLRYTADSIHDWTAAHQIEEVLK